MFFPNNPIQTYTIKNQTNMEYFHHKHMSHVDRKLQLLAES